MRVLLLDSAPLSSPLPLAVRHALAAIASQRGWSHESVYLPGLPIADCTGDFKCWTRTPGVCTIDDANRVVARALIASDVVVFLTPVTFGGYSSELKKALDHAIQDISPFFQVVAGETHHQRRYDRYPALVAIGIADHDRPEETRVFRTLAARNAVNLHNSRHASVVLTTPMDERAVAIQIEGLLDWVTHRSPTATSPSLPPVPTPPFGPRASDWVGPTSSSPGSALLLAGSPKGIRSSSAFLGAYLMEQLARRGVETRTIFLVPAQRSPAKLAALLAATDKADLVVLSFPLYVDSLPAPVIRCLERVAAHHAAHAGRSGQTFMAVCNSGFPESRQNDTALAICRCFADAVGWRWAGGLPLGGGHGLVQSQPLATRRGPARFVLPALDLTAQALRSGSPIPEEAVRLFAKPFVPAWLYRIMGHIGWHVEARRARTTRSLRARPYEPTPDNLQEHQ